MVLAIAGTAVLLLAAVAWLGVRGLQARSALTAAVPQVERLQEQLLAGDEESALSTLNGLQTSTDLARNRTSDPIWTAASRLPWAGPNLSAIAAVAAGLDELGDTVLPSLVASADALDVRAMAPVDGRIDLEPLAAAAPFVARAAASMSRVDATVGAIRTDNVLDAVARPVTDVQARMHELNATLATAQTATLLLPSMLGADGPRSYLLLLQSNAELRATGGMPGALSVITADNGRLELTEQSTAAAVHASGGPDVTLTPEDEALYTDRMGTYIADVNFTPDFPTAAGLAREMWRQYSGKSVDGVLATDPVALSYLLAATGPVADGSGGELAADNAVDMLLSGAYARFPDTSDQNAYFAGVAASVFRSLVDGRASPTATLPAMARAAAEHRLLVWSARADERAALDGTVLTGDLPADAGDTSTIGVFFNDGTGSKMDYYLDTRVAVIASTCDRLGPGGESTAAAHTVRVTLANNAPLDADETLGPSVTGSGAPGGAPRGDIETSIVLIGPVAGTIDAVERDGNQVGTAGYDQDGRPATTYSVQLRPGEDAVVDVTMSDPSVGDILDVWSTPTKDQSGYLSQQSCSQ